MNCSASKYAYAQFDDQYGDFGVLKDVTSSDPLLFGCFEEKDGSGYAFTAVNMSNVSKGGSASFTFKTDGQYKVSVWKDGIRKDLKAENGVYSIDLVCGEGVFVTLER